MVIEKVVPLDLILRDSTVAELYILDKMERQATHALLRGLCFAIERLIPDALQKSFVPESWRIHALVDKDEARVRLPSGRLVIGGTPDARLLVLDGQVVGV